MAVESVEELAFSNVPHFQGAVEAGREQKVAARMPSNLADGTGMSRVTLDEGIGTASSELFQMYKPAGCEQCGQESERSRVHTGCPRL